MAIVDVKQGKLQGAKTITDNGKQYYEFLCVPYAQPPIGELRFKSPQPGHKWDGIRDATKINENNVSCQIDPVKGSLAGSEDCLYLNVFTPKLPEESTTLLPVMVFIHGGGFTCSNGILKSELGPDYLIDNDVVVVTINYRLGIFGFLSLDIPEAAGNMGLKDQVLALKWVQDNIEYFGGDKNNVTLFGISAGSASIEYLIVSQLSKGLFHKGILQSGSCLNHWATNREPHKLINELLSESDYKGSLDDTQAKYEYLMKAQPSELIKLSLKAVENLDKNIMCCGFVPTIEKDFGNGDAFITNNPYKIIKKGTYNRVPVIKGFCDKEGYLSFMWKHKSIQKLMTDRNFINYFPYNMEDEFKKPLESQFQTAYFEKPSADHEEIAVDFFGHLDFVAGIWLSGKTMASHGNKVFFYNLCYDGNMNFCKILFNLNKPGCSHGDDLAYIFKHDITKRAQDVDIKVRTCITKMWTDFAKTCDPTPDDTVRKWLPYTDDSPTYLKIDDRITVIESSYEPKKLKIFEDIYQKYEL